MTDELIVHSKPELRNPVLVAAFRGWNDGGQAASLAAGFLAKLWNAQQFAEIDPEGFFDFQVTRPQVSLVDGVTRKVEWPETEFRHASLPAVERDAVLLTGNEPNVRWKTFSRLIVELAQELQVELVVTLGSLLADVPHTRPAPVTGSASDAELVERLGLETSRYEGPTGIVGVLHDACRTAGIASASLWAAVPHYVSLAPSPRAAQALCDRLANLLSVDIDTEELREAGEAYAEQVSAAVATDEETQAYVEELEQRTDQMPDEIQIPSGEALAAELTRFLRDRERGDGTPGPSS
jgi:proteasome assembly chaperone (PAC2) family protein